jgi:hypothetical protein
MFALQRFAALEIDYRDQRISLCDPRFEEISDGTHEHATIVVELDDVTLMRNNVQRASGNTVVCGGAPGKDRSL